MLYYVGGCHDFLEQTTPENRAELNRLLIEYKKVKLEQIDTPAAELFKQAPFEFNFTDLSIDKKGNIRRIREKQRKQEKRDFQKIKKEWEDR